METVFISSVIGGFEEVRRAVREAVESVGMRPMMAEMAGARPQSPQQALLAEVAAADIYLLILGPRYGNPGTSGLAPTEEEFEEAKRRSKPIIVLRQEVEMEPNQRDFLGRASGGWEEGILFDRFTDDRDVGLKVVRALTNVRRLGAVRELAPVAQERALALARGDERGSHGFRSGSRARVVLVPLADSIFLDDVALNEASLPEWLSESARSSGLVSQASGIDQEVRRGGIRLEAGRERIGHEANIFIGEAGDVLVEGSVAGDDPHFGSSRIDPERLAALIERAARFASDVWRHIDPRGEVQQVATAVGIPDARMKVYGRPRAPSSSLSMGGAMRLPHRVIAPERPIVVRRVDVEDEDVRKRLVASVRRVYADADALEDDA
jgi:hypothetical protein